MSRHLSPLGMAGASLSGLKPGVVLLLETVTSGRARHGGAGAWVLRLGSI